MCDFVKSGSIIIENMDAFLERKKRGKAEQKASWVRARRGTKRRGNHRN